MTEAYQMPAREGMGGNTPGRLPPTCAGVLRGAGRHASESWRSIKDDEVAYLDCVQKTWRT